ncbi:MAG: hypothetical protein PHE68_04755 [Candidatus Peribacteraceae bacterium]|nr:hypothetical protein [Candidatus Peribacteraceae bacterium]MDD5074714.1 hypothetical protein [Candidatus Peribacteraceae bacterium]
MPKKTPRTCVTPTVLLQHMQGMEQRLTSRMDGLGNKMDRMHVNLSAQIDAIDQRLDVIEIENLPKRVAKLERVVGIR